MKYFIGNWKMFGVPKSINILNKINSFHSRDKNRKKYRVIFTPPYTLIENYAKHFKNKRISIGSQNCYQKDQFSSNTAAVSPYMIRSVGAKYSLVLTSSSTTKLESLKQKYGSSHYYYHLDLSNSESLQKNLVARRKLKKGSILSEDDILAKRTGGEGISAIKINSVLGRRISRNFEVDQIIEIDE